MRGRIGNKWVVVVGMSLLSLLSMSCTAMSGKPEIAMAASLPQEPRQVKVPVYVLEYGMPSVDVEALTLKIMDYLERGTMYHGAGEAFLDFEIYKVANAAQLLIPTRANSDLADYEAIYFENGVDDLCALAREGKIKQVWVWGNGHGGEMQETVDNGPLWQNPRETNVPNCGVQLTTVGNHRKMPVASAIEAHIHRYEQFFSQRYRYAFNRQTAIPYAPVGAQCSGSDLDDGWGWCVEDFITGYYGVTQASVVGYTGSAFDSSDIAQCGWAHYPPNITWEYRLAHKDESRYVYDYTGTVLSTCRNWRLDVDEAEIAEEINCTAWGCDKPGNDNQAEYFVWWMQNIPGPNNTNYDENGNRMPNWWAALYAD